MIFSSGFFNGRLYFSFRYVTFLYISSVISLSIRAEHLS
ncbi:hypothetical protein EGU33_09300 [Acinetobacter baumannii]|uniref:Uncharacterized protein n=1 Tax=Acinetobacter baumannii TaxID=470 RepID=A0A3A4H9R7_ACIBA|nr:hypothetical protein DLD53_20440 [Acinetobacter baumannii]AYX94867.1 hypothetical protein EGY13_00075 [Acinetobacter sp. FDAARGOS_493]RSC79271.1 hypothetical protein EGT38_00130 [Acinetobacter sp. FDAARGOS_495]RSF52354.1 hypothetical protein EGS71_00155 [Acinetobacter sp. FDAARGOS_559]AXB17594.1 hypothetical protein DPV67_19340 [Acinetobacter baumannii]